MPPAPRVHALRIAQILVDQVQIEPFRIEMPARPSQRGAMVLVRRIADDPEEIRVAPRPADSLGRPCLPAFEAERMARRRVERQPVLDPDQVLPAVPEIVGIGEAGVAPDEILQPDLGMIEDAGAAEAVVQQGRIAVAQPADAEFVQMAVGPAECRLQD